MAVSDFIGVALLYGPFVVMDAQDNGRFYRIADKVTHWTRCLPRALGYLAAAGSYLAVVIFVWLVGRAFLAELVWRAAKR